MAMSMGNAKNDMNSNGNFVRLKREQFYKLTADDYEDLEQIRADNLVPYENSAPMWFKILRERVLDNPKYSMDLKLDIAYMFPRKEAIIEWGWENYNPEALLALNDIRPINANQATILAAKNPYFDVPFMKDFFSLQWVFEYAQEAALEAYLQKHGLSFELISEITDFIDNTQLNRPQFFAKVRQFLNIDETFPDNWVRQMVKL